MPAVVDVLVLGRRLRQVDLDQGIGHAATPGGSGWEDLDGQVLLDATHIGIGARGLVHQPPAFDDE